MASIVGISTIPETQIVAHYDIRYFVLWCHTKVIFLDVQVIYTWLINNYFLNHNLNHNLNHIVVILIWFKFLGWARWNNTKISRHCKAIGLDIRNSFSLYHAIVRYHFNFCHKRSPNSVPTWHWNASHVPEQTLPITQESWVVFYWYWFPKKFQNW